MPVEPRARELVRPRELGEALRLLAADAERRPLGGGTGIVPALRHGSGEPGLWLAVDRIAGFARIRDTPEAIWIGAGARLRDVERHPRMWTTAPLVVEAIAAVAGPAVRNAATIGGSLADSVASPDPATALVASAAEVQVEGWKSMRRCLVADLVSGRAGTGRGELIVAVRVPDTVIGGAYLRFTIRGAADRPIVTVAVAIHADGTVRVALGAAVAGVVGLAGAAEAIRVGADVGDAARVDLANLPVIDDDRADATYRRRIATVLIGRAADAAQAQVGARRSSGPP